MSFLKRKLGMFLRKDRSRKGNVDKEIRELVERINSDDRFFTTSSCSGRIVVIERKSPKKIHSRWLYVSHSEGDAEQVWSAIQSAKYPTWFRMEPVILHVCADSLDAASWLMEKAQAAGLKRSGIISWRKKVMIEIMGTDYMDTIVHDGDKPLVDRAYVRILVDQANKKLERNKKRIDSLVNQLTIISFSSS